MKGKNRFGDSRGCSTPHCQSEAICTRHLRKGDGSYDLKRPIYACVDCYTHFRTPEAQLNPAHYCGVECTVGLEGEVSIHTGERVNNG